MDTPHPTSVITTKAAVSALTRGNNRTRVTPPDALAALTDRVPTIQRRVVGVRYATPINPPSLTPRDAHGQPTTDKRNAKADVPRSVLSGVGTTGNLLRCVVIVALLDEMRHAADP